MPSATLAVIALVSASEGYLFTALTIAWRALFLVAGVLLITTQTLPSLLGGLLLLFGAAWLWAGQKGLIRGRAPVTLPSNGRAGSAWLMTMVDDE